MSQVIAKWVKSPKQSPLERFAVHSPDGAVFLFAVEGGTADFTVFHLFLPSCPEVMIPLQVELDELLFGGVFIYSESGVTVKVFDAHAPELDVLRVRLEPAYHKDFEGRYVFLLQMFAKRDGGISAFKNDVPSPFFPDVAKCGLYVRFG